LQVQNLFGLCSSVVNRIFLYGMTAAVVAGVSIASARIVTPALAAPKLQSTLIGMSEDRIRSCLGVPNGVSDANSVKTLSYYTGEVSTASNKESSSNVIHVAMRYSCELEVVIAHGRVSRVRYNPSTDIPTAQNERCSQAMENCLSEEPGPAIYSIVQPTSGKGVLSTPPPLPHACSHEELVQIRIAKLNGYIGAPGCK
jgi:hypothetical protein